MEKKNWTCAYQFPLIPMKYLSVQDTLRPCKTLGSIHILLKTRENKPHTNRSELDAMIAR